MLDGIIEFAKSSRLAFPFMLGKTLEIGSCDVNGSIRTAFPDTADYVGIDLAVGPGVDRVLPADQIEATWGRNSFDTVLCCEMLEHDRTPWITIEQIHKVLKPGGHLFISTPTYGFPVHRYPKDYYRYGEDAFREVFFSGCKILKLGTVTDRHGNPVICCLGRKEPESHGASPPQPEIIPVDAANRQNSTDSLARSDGKLTSTRKASGRGMARPRPAISVIICSIDGTKFKRTSEMYRQAIAGEPFEIIRVARAGSLAAGYNQAAESAAGELVFFSHDDVEFLAPNLRQRIQGHMAHCDILGVAGTRYYAGGNWGNVGAPYLAGQVAFPLGHSRPPRPGYNILIFGGVESARVNGIQAADGLFLAAHRRVLEKVKFDAKTFDGFHGYDVDFTYSAFRMGLEVAVATDLAPVWE